MEIKDAEKKIDDILTRGVGQFVDPDDTFRKKLLAKASGMYTKDIIVKFGVDPNRPDIHLGHAVVLRKLRGLQDLGCKVVFLVGDFTAQIGDPTGKSKVRPEIEQKEVDENVKTYLDQVGKILKVDDIKSFAWVRNSDWFTAITDLVFPEGTTLPLHVEKDGKKVELPINANSFIGKALAFEDTRMQKRGLGLKEISVITLRSFLQALRKITHAQLIDRDMFQERINRGEELYLHEMMYPVLQGIDSFIFVRMFGSCDIEVGGTDQHFNMLMGRTVMKNEGHEPQSVLSFDLLVGTDGKEKMSKSLGNYIGITDAPGDMYGKVMSIPDSALDSYFELCTYTPMGMVGDILMDITKGGNPRDAKMRLAKEIVSIYHGEAAAIHAEEEFVNVFQKGGMPEVLPEVPLKAEGGEAFDVVKQYFASQNEEKSNGEIRRLFEQGAVTKNDADKLDLHDVLQSGDVVRVGKKTWFRAVKG